MRTTNHPRVSIGLPVYNGARYLREALDSILGQTYGAFELIISDNASTDETRAICEEYAARDPRIRYSRSERNRGAAWNYNRVFELAGGEYFKWAAHDDVLAPEFLERCVEVLNRDPSVILCYPWTRFIDGDSRVLRDSDINGKITAESYDPFERLRDVLTPGNGCFQVFGLIRSRALAQTPLIATFWGSDLVLLAWLALLGRFHEVREPLFLNRLHPNQSMAMQWRAYAIMAWYLPEHQGKITLPFWLEWGAYFQPVHRLPLSPIDRLRCYALLLDFPRRNHRIKLLARDLVVAAALAVARPVIEHARLESGGA